LVYNSIMDEVKETHIGRDLGLGFDEKSYTPQGVKYDPGESPLDRVNMVNADSVNQADRLKMRKTVAWLREEITHLDPEKDLVKCLENLFVSAALKGGTSQDFLDGLENPGQLFWHLHQTGETITKFAEVARLQTAPIIMGNLLPERTFILLEFFARTHDLGKLAGPPNAQIDPDHEVIYKEIISSNMLGRTYRSISGKEIVFDKSDVGFLEEMSYHEDIWREESFASQIKSLNERVNLDLNPQVAVQRARMIFHFVDIFGDALNYDEKEGLTISNDKDFRRRFVDLYRRHLNLPIDESSQMNGFNWKIGKVFRPQWGLHGVAGLTWTFHALSDLWQLKIDPNLVSRVQGGIFEVLDDAIAVINRQTSKDSELTTKEKEIIEIGDKLQLEIKSQS